MNDNEKRSAKIKWQLWDFECDNCEKGVVQIITIHKQRTGITQEVSGCLDCKKDFGIKQASKLKRIFFDI